jgi:hypothetical protein
MRAVQGSVRLKFAGENNIVQPLCLSQLLAGLEVSNISLRNAIYSVSLDSEKVVLLKRLKLNS